MIEGVFALIPVKDPGRGKSRLAPLLDAAQRAALSRRLANQTFACCAEVLGAQQTVVVTASASIAAEARRRGLVVVDEDAPGDLNAALALAAHTAAQRGARALLVVPTDLVLLTAQVLRAAAWRLLQEPGGLLAPDRHGAGTNLFGIMPARADLFQFGTDSFARHGEALRAAGLALRVHADPALALDVDSPDDYRLWQRADAEREAVQPGRRAA